MHFLDAHRVQVRKRMQGFEKAPGSASGFQPQAANKGGQMKFSIQVFMKGVLLSVTGPGTLLILDTGAFNLNLRHSSVINAGRSVGLPTEPRPELMCVCFVS